jgi:hypothetical protein
MVVEHGLNFNFGSHQTNGEYCWLFPNGVLKTATPVLCPILTGVLKDLNDNHKCITHRIYTVYLKHLNPTLGVTMFERFLEQIRYGFAISRSASTSYFLNWYHFQNLEILSITMSTTASFSPAPIGGANIIKKKTIVLDRSVVRRSRKSCRLLAEVTTRSCIEANADYRLCRRYTRGSVATAGLSRRLSMNA